MRQFRKKKKETANAEIFIRKVLDEIKKEKDEQNERGDPRPLRRSEEES